MTCFKYQVYMYGHMYGHILNAILQSQDYESSSDCPHPLIQAALPPLYCSITFTHLEENINKYP